MDCMLSRFAEDTKVGGVADSAEGRIRIQNDLKGLEKMFEINLIIFKTDK